MHPKGMTFVEIMVTLAVLGSIFVIYGAIISSIRSQRYAENASIAYSIAEAELEKVRAESFDSLTERTDTDFIGLTFNHGRWETVADASAPSAPNVLSLTSVATGTVGATGLIQPSVNFLADFTFSAKIKILNDSPAGWRAGLMFRAKDNSNYYRWTFEETKLKLEKVENGTATLIYSKTVSLNKNIYYPVKIIASGANLALYFNDILQQTVVDTVFSSGVIGILSLNSALVNIDDIVADGNSWNFDSSGTFPKEWERTGVYDLKSGRMDLSIANYGGSENIKEIIAKVSWEDENGTRAAELKTLISR